MEEQCTEEPLQSSHLHFANGAVLSKGLGQQILHFFHGN